MALAFCESAVYYLACPGQEAVQGGRPMSGPGAIVLSPWIAASPFGLHHLRVRRLLSDLSHRTSTKGRPRHASAHHRSSHQPPLSSLTS